MTRYIKPTKNDLSVQKLEQTHEGFADQDSKDKSVTYRYLSNCLVAIIPTVRPVDCRPDQAYDCGYAQML